MTEIEKMFENAGIKPYIYCSKPQLDCDAREARNCKQECEYYSGEAFYPPFTAEKQLKIIEWFISNCWWLNLKSLDKRLDFSLDFDEKLAKLVNGLWESFDDQEKEEIRGILDD